MSKNIKTDVFPAQKTLTSAQDHNQCVCKSHKPGSIAMSKVMSYSRSTGKSWLIQMSFHMKCI